MGQDFPEVTRKHVAVSDLAALSRQANKLAREIAELEIAMSQGSITAQPSTMVAVDYARRLLKERRQREAAFGWDLFADPAWDMMLDLFVATTEQRLITVSSLCIAAAVPATTALRWVKTLTAEGIFIRTPDISDHRRVFIKLAPDVYDRMSKLIAGWIMNRAVS